MSIKKVKPTSKSGFKQGYYNPINPQKYIGEHPIIYRSSWERKFCHWCDHNEEVIKPPPKDPDWFNESKDPETIEELMCVDFPESIPIGNGYEFYIGELSLRQQHKLQYKLQIWLRHILILTRYIKLQNWLRII